ncbi:NAD(P)-dependent oxidoreductase [Nocardia cyriacigeorgica]|uniref:NAD(P)-dependent oxidoreductase n=1 Tax=Nocardia cyriacigeorgica TaxID=135487 RepID=A0A6P1D7L5_9NOCA|nr:NAD(P)-binding domain-containing protein [Nocardia cyriacigeorgica]NEW37811.1 NAD(P)-dependent oxidoreductase [Nocardia cyriacigeorgica]NEW45589.1 NAD(P)-dependent oxidoreductase [Nocardia cyriacigeorgica]NEW48804.1 NAD(P)-dependent oxidoreductase [Nocardia cyriacigeorgica]NEW56192.1 NAD(P)-dependent oxidoreductase [Nocardia cyriacigeorgica]
MNVHENAEQVAVAVLGLGEMGSALAATLVDAGYPVTVWNRSQNKADPLVAKGARRAATPEAAIGAAEVVIINVKGGAVAAELLRAAGSVLPGRTVIDLTDGSSEQSRATGQSAIERGANYLHGQIMTIAPAIGSPDAVVFYGGLREVFHRHEALLRVLGGRATHVSSDPGASVLYGMAVHDIMWGLLNGYLHAAALLGNAGISIGDFSRQAEPSLAALPSLFPMLAEEIDRAEFATQYGALEHHLPSIDDLIAESRARGIDVELPTYTRNLVAKALDAGHAHDSYARLVERFGVGEEHG